MACFFINIVKDNEYNVSFKTVSDCFRHRGFFRAKCLVEPEDAMNLKLLL